jgi:2-C-methyl-D-erythritol 4-phosphate cytidylyltransferase
MTSTAKYAIIVAGGKGLRMGSETPKQFLEMKGRPVLMHTVESFYQYSKEIQLILVLSPAHLKTWAELCNRYQFEVPLTVQPGGSTRFQSVKKGLQTISGNGLVAIHDGVRPLVDPRMIHESYETAEKYNSAVAAIPLKNSIREILSHGSRALNRASYCIIQTPQTFKVDLIKEAYKVEEKDIYTDDASVWEAVGNQVTLFEGMEKNLKITTIQDLVVAEFLLKLK